MGPGEYKITHDLNEHVRKVTQACIAVFDLVEANAS